VRPPPIAARRLGHDIDQVILDLVEPKRAENIVSK
jgi:hypothetical protein